MKQKKKTLLGIHRIHHWHTRKYKIKYHFTKGLYLSSCDIRPTQGSKAKMATTALVSCRRSYAILPAASSTCICAYADYRHATAPYNNNSGIHNGANQSEASTAGSDKRDGCVNACYWTNYYDSCVLFIHVVRLLRMAEHMRQRGWWRTPYARPFCSTCYIEILRFYFLFLYSVIFDLHNVEQSIEFWIKQNEANSKIIL